MSALFNATPRRGGNEPPDAGFASGILPEAKGSPIGVSVEYAQEESRHWFVLRVSYGRAIKAGKLLTKYSIHYYLPMHKVVKMVKERRRKLTEPLLPNLIFAYARADEIQDLLDNYNPGTLLTYYYNHFSIGPYGKNPPLTIDEQSMRNFIRVTSVTDEDVRVISRRFCHFKSGDRVRVTAGEFEGVEGRVARAAGQQRVIVELEGLCLVATAYIPTAYLRTLP